MYKLLIIGTVQGVGFRPFIYNACKEASLKGYVQNVGTGVEVVVNDKERFLEILEHVPSLARITDVQCEEIEGAFDDFSIRKKCWHGVFRNSA